MTDRNAEMSHEEFEDLAAAYGPDPTQWPPAKRVLARALLTGPQAAVAQKALDRARDLDLALAALAATERATEIPDSLTARILSDAATVAAELAPQPQSLSASATRSRFWLADLAEMFGGWRAAGASAAAMALIGLGLGYATPDGAASALGFENALPEEMAVDLGWSDGSGDAEFEMFGGAG